VKLTAPISRIRPATLLKRAEALREAELPVTPTTLRYSVSTLIEKASQLEAYGIPVTPATLGYAVETMRDRADVLRGAGLALTPGLLSRSEGQPGRWALEQGLTGTELRYLRVLLMSMPADERGALMDEGFASLLEGEISAAASELEASVPELPSEVYAKLGMLKAISSPGSGMLEDIIRVTVAHEKNLELYGGDMELLAEGYASDLSGLDSVDLAALPIFFNEVLFTDLMLDAGDLWRSERDLRSSLKRLFKKDGYAHVPLYYRSRIIDRVVDLNREFLGESRDIRPVSLTGAVEAEDTYFTDMRRGVEQLLDAVLGLGTAIVELPLAGLRLTADVYASRRWDDLTETVFMRRSSSGAEWYERIRSLFERRQTPGIVSNLNNYAHILYAK